MYRKVTGLVVRSTDYKEADKILTVITDQAGKITVKAPGALRKGSKVMASSRLFAYSHMSLYVKNGRFTLMEADIEDMFDGLSGDLENMSAASYIAEVLASDEDENLPDEEILLLARGSLHALSKGTYPSRHIKAVFELRYMSLLGYAPDMDTCAICGDEVTAGYFIPGEGIMHCGRCAKGGIRLDSATMSAVRYIINAPAKKIFSFSIKESEQLRQMAERHLLSCLDRRFRTLDFYKTILQ